MAAAPSREERRGSDRPETALTGVILSAISLAANPDYYQDPFISGRCLCRSDPEVDLEFPCTNVGVILANDKGQEVHRLQTADGEFVFPAEKDRAYTIRISSQRHSVFLQPPSPLKMGDDVVIHLVSR